MVIIDYVAFFIEGEPMPESTTTNLRQRLREETSASHARLDQVMGLYPPFASLDNYRRYLLGMDSLFQYCEASTTWVDSCVDLPARDKLVRSLIASDIATVSGTERIDGNSPFNGNSPSDKSNSLTEGTHWGRAYVMEGSAMGATFLVKQAEQELPADVGKSFLAQLARDAKTRWSIFADALASTDANPDDAVAAAKDVFDYAYNVFGRDVI